MKAIVYGVFMVIFAAVLSVSCEKDVILDVESGAEQIVVEGWIYQDGPPVVYLSKTLPAYGTFDDTDFIDATIVPGADVRVNGVRLAERTGFDLPPAEQERLLQVFWGVVSDGVDDPDSLSTDVINGLFAFVPIYVDTTGTLVGQELMTYNLTVATDSQSLSAQTTIPEESGLDSLSYELTEDPDGFAQVFLHITVPTDVDRYIRLAVKRNDEIFWYPGASGSVFDNGIYSGQGSIRLPVERAYPYDTEVEDGEFGLYQVGDTVTLQWSDVTKPTYDYWLTLEGDGGDTPFSTASQIRSNINGGLGIWGGYLDNYYTVIIEE